MSTRLCLSTAGTYSRRFPHFYRTATPDFCLCSSASVRCEYAAGAKLFESRQNFLSTVNGPSSSRALATHGKEAGSIQSHYTEWSGLQPWRLSETDNRRVWGHKGPTALVSPNGWQFSARHTSYLQIMHTCHCFAGRPCCKGRSAVKCTNTCSLRCRGKACKAASPAVLQRMATR